MWKSTKALAMTAPTSLLAAWMVPPPAAEILGELPAAPEPVVIMLVGTGLISMAWAIRRATPAKG